MSLWSWVNRPSELSKLTNPLFEANNLVIWPSVAPQSLQLWEGKSCILCKPFIDSPGCSLDCLWVQGYVDTAIYIRYFLKIRRYITSFYCDKNTKLTNVILNCTEMVKYITLL